MAKHDHTADELGSAETTDDVGERAGAAGESNAQRRRSKLRLRRPVAWSAVRAALLLGCVALLAVTALAGWEAVRGQHAQQSQRQRAVFLQAARQGALNLTTISYTEADADVKRIADSATGTFYDDFRKRSASFVDVVKKTGSKTEGTITEAGIESTDTDSAQVLVAVSVKTSNMAGADEQPRLWRMRISVQKAGDAVKVANVQFVP